jgi:simple sugar transport system ATP-binding protein
VIFISHKLHEVKASPTGYRPPRRALDRDPHDGRREPARAGRADGRPRVELARRLARTPPISPDPALEVDGAERARRPRRGGGRGRDASRAQGEILGVAGVAGNGQRELAEAITGMRPRARTVASRAASCSRRPARRSRPGRPRPEDRLGTGVAPSLSIAENSVLKSYRGRGVSRAAPAGGRSASARRADRALRRRTPGPQRRARDLSGGNLQKLVLGREFSAQPKVLIAARRPRPRRRRDRDGARLPARGAREGVACC